VSADRARRALILARGTGTRMLAADDAASLSADQQAAASQGHKAFMPIAGRPFIEHQLALLERVGISNVCVVIGPEPGITGDFHQAVQHEPLGTADAVWRAERWADGHPVIVLNGDNLYPAAAIEAVASLDGPGVAGFDRDDLVATSNITTDKVKSFAVLEQDVHGHLQRIIEKPSAEELAAMPAPILVGMNLWKFDSWIFEACRDVEWSPRGELELPAAVMLARSRGSEFTVVR
jgi:glucose-1-phosphate thymidylyltransferase